MYPLEVVRNFSSAFLSLFVHGETGIEHVSGERARPKRWRLRRRAIIIERPRPATDPGRDSRPPARHEIKIGPLRHRRGPLFTRTADARGRYTALEGGGPKKTVAYRYRHAGPSSSMLMATDKRLSR